MYNGKAEHWRHIVDEHVVHEKNVAAMQIMDSLRRLEPMSLGFAANQLTHCLMTATLARRDGASDEEVVAALTHDLGKLLSIPNHGPIAAEMIKPYVSEDIYHAVYWHQDFQGRYYYNFLGKPTNLRDRFRNESWFAFAETLVDKWDAPAFDPAYQIDTLESFEPEVVRVFSSPKRLSVIPAKEVVGSS
jgi:predicted HD phosphohydrolase